MAGADQKITQLNALSQAASDDVFAIVDADDIQTKKITMANFLGKPGSIGNLIPDTGEFTSLEVAAGSIISEFSTDVTLIGNSDTVLSTEKAVKTYVDTSIADISNIHNDLSGLQGGDSTSEFYHLTRNIHDSFYFGSLTLGIGIGALGTNLEVDFGSDTISLNIAGGNQALINSSGLTLSSGASVDEF